MSKIITKNGELSSSAAIEISAGGSGSLVIDSTYLILSQSITAPPTPNANHGTLYASGSNAHLYFKNDQGQVYDIAASGGAGSGDVTKVGTPADNQIGVWTGDGTIEGDSNFTWDAAKLTVTGKGEVTNEFTSSVGVFTTKISASLLELKQTGSVAFSEGTAYYDISEHTITVMNDESDVRHQLGQEGFVRVRNESGATITNGSVVYISGSGTGGELRPSIGLALANDAVTSEVIGLATHDIENNTFGYVTFWGKVNDLDTSAFSEGETLRLSDVTPGALTNGSITAGNYNVIVGYVVNSSATTGSILVSVNADLGLGAGDSEELISTVRKGSAGTLNPGQVVYLSGYNSGQDVAEVELAQANSAATMPSFGILRDTVTNNTNGTVVNFGRIAGFNTSGFSVGDELYVDADVAGGLIVLKPSGSNLIQKVAKVIRSNVSNGILEVFGAGRTNDLPTLATDNVWLGNSGSTPVATSRSGVDDTAIHDNVAGEIDAITGKTTLVGSDVFIIEDSAAGNAKKKVFAGNITGSGGVDELAKVSSNDSTAGYLNGKLVAGTNITLNERNDAGNETLEISASVGGRTDSGVSATDPGGAVEGDKYYNSILEMEMRYDGFRSKWLSIEASTFIWGRSANTAAGSYFQGPDGITFSSTQGFTSLHSGTVVAFGYNRTDTDAAIFQIAENGTEISFVSSSAVEGVSTSLDGDFSPTGSLAVLNKSGGNTVSNGFGWVKVKWRI